MAGAMRSWLGLAGKVRVGVRQEQLICSSSPDARQDLRPEVLQPEEAPPRRAQGSTLGRWLICMEELSFSSFFFF